MTVLRKGCDSYSHADPPTLGRLGLKFVIRYVGLGSGKLLTPPEVKALHDAGFDILGNPEMDTTDGSGGFAQGVRYATVANDHYDTLGAPQSAVLAYSIDANRTADWVRPYFQGIASVHRRPAGGYGGTEMVAMLDEGLIVVWIQANAGSWSGEKTSNFDTHPRAHFRQHLATTAFGFNYDPEDQMAPSDRCGFWLAPANAVQPPPIPQENDMPTVVAADIALDPAHEGDYYILDALGGIHAGGNAPPMDGNATAGWGKDVNPAVMADPPPYWTDQAPARRLVIVDWSVPSGVVLDCLGAVHPFGGYKVAPNKPLWPGGFIPPTP